MAVALLLMVAVGTVVRSSLVLDAVDVLASTPEVKNGCASYIVFNSIIIVKLFTNPQPKLLYICIHVCWRHC